MLRHLPFIEDGWWELDKMGLIFQPLGSHSHWRNGNVPILLGALGL